MPPCHLRSPAAAASGQSRALGRLASLACATLLTACSAVPFDHPKSESYALEPSESTRLGRSVAEWNQAYPGTSGFCFLDDGQDALGARLLLIERAERTIDAQYFLIKGDLAGALFTGKLLRAADRGVRVRLLIDDIFTTGLDDELSLLNAHPRVEVRLFNPIARRGFRYLNLLGDFRRANRRMHNKAFIVDNAFVIVGGRNIADEYYRTRPDVEFADFELLGLGPVAPDVSETFDIFWNSARSVPMEAFGRRVDEEDLDEIRRAMDAEADAAGGVYQTAVSSRYLDDVDQRRILPVAATATVVTDHPEKLEKPVADEHKVLGAELVRILQSARREVLVLTPYFVPREPAFALLGELESRGVRVVVVTNSLASTNHLMVHSGYGPRRKRLLQAGVELYEIRPDALSREAPDGPDRLTLHSKVAIVDREVLFVGSPNLDPRSIDINTEMGLFVASPELAGAFAEQAEDDLRQLTWRVELDEDGDLVWRDRGGSGEVEEDHEPQAGWWRRFKVGFFRLLPIEGQL
jgi:putative cardiolipin synthase